MRISGLRWLWGAGAVMGIITGIATAQDMAVETAPSAVQPAEPSLESEASDAEAITTGQLGGTVLKVNDETITSGEILSRMNPTFQEMEKGLDEKVFLTKAQPLILRAVTAMMYDLLIFQHAKGILSKNENYEDIIQKAMDAERKTLIARYNGEVTRAREELEKKGTSIEEELEAIQRELIVSSFREAYFMPTLEITRGEKQQYYWLHQQKEFELPTEVEFRLIEIPVQAFAKSGAARAEAAEKAKAEAEAALVKLSEGLEFADAAKEFSRFRPSEGGYWKGNPDSLQERYAEAVKAMEEAGAGARTGIVEGNERYFIGLLIRKQDARTVPFSEAQDQITEEIRKERWQKFFADLSGKLLDKAVVGDVNAFVQDTAIVAYRVYQKIQ